MTEPERMREAVEAVAQALCAWPMVAVDDREHNTATHMATDAVKAALPFLGGLPPKPSPEAVAVAAETLGPEGVKVYLVPQAMGKCLQAAYAVDACPSGCPPPEGEK